MAKDTADETNPKLPAVEPAQESPAQDETPKQDDATTPPIQDDAATEPPVQPTPPVASPEQTVEPAESSPHHEQVTQFANTLQTAVDHADTQAQVASEFQDRWAWWRNKLGEFLHEVKQHVQG